jgi:SagB-type dehydrogenase family enzyme
MDTIALPAPDLSVPVTLTAVLAARRTRREVRSDPLDRDALSFLLWAAHGITSEDGRHTAPSAGFTDPTTITAVTADWMARYRPAPHDLEVVAGGDLRPEFARVSGRQSMLDHAPLTLAVSALVERTARKYGARADRYVALEAGHIAQNVLLAAEALGLAACPVGSFDDEALQGLLRLGPGDVPLYLLPVGHPA